MLMLCEASTLPTELSLQPHFSPISLDVKLTCQGHLTGLSNWEVVEIISELGKWFYHAKFQTSNAVVSTEGTTGWGVVL